ncbi:thiamine pyrophosphate-dependent enzyme [candidate division KSB1 bacterium]
MNKKIFDVPEEDILCQGHMACIGCGVPLAMKFMLKGLGKKTILVVPACCYSVIDGAYPYSASGVTLVHVPISSGASVSSGIRAGLDMINDTETQVVAWSGDGGTYDIGFQALSGASERNENIIYVCYDNEAYMNTGIHRSSASPFMVWTTTTPIASPKSVPKKNIDFIIAEHKIPYVATASIAFPDDLIRKFVTAKNIKGMKFIHILTPCPTGWRANPSQTIKIARLAVQSGIFPLFEIKNGEFTLNYDEKDKTVEDYFKLQGRFSHLKRRDIINSQKDVDKRWKKIIKMRKII